MNDKVSVESQSTALGVQDVTVDPSSYRIKKLGLFPLQGKFENSISSESESDKTDPNFYNLIPQVDSIVITEGLQQNGIHVTMHCIDAVGILERLRIQGGEEIHMIIEQRNINTAFHVLLPGSGYGTVTKTIDLKLFISDIKNFEKVNLNTQKYIIECVTKPAYINQLTVLNTPFNDTPGVLIKKIAGGESPSLGIDTNEWEDSGYGKKMKGIYPKLRPFDAINWILRNANDGDTPVFFYESARDGFQLKSWEELLSKDPYDEYNNYPYPHNAMKSESGEKLTLESPEYYDTVRKIIQKITSKLGFSTYNSASKGAYASNLSSVDVSTKSFTEKPYEYDIDKEKRLNKFKPFSDKPKFADGSFDKNKNARNFFISENAYAYSNEGNYHSDVKQHIQKVASYLANMNMMTHEITIPGDPYLAPGTKITLNLWKIQDGSGQEDNPDMEERKKGDQFMNGDFIINKIQHWFRPTGYTAELHIIKDSSLLDYEEEGFKIK